MGYDFPMRQDPMNPVTYPTDRLRDESRITQSFGSPRSPVPLIIVPKGVFPPPPAAARYRHSTVVPLADSRIFVVAEWTSGDRDDGEPALHHVEWH